VTRALASVLSPPRSSRWNTVGVRGDAEGDDPSVDSDGDGVAISSTALGLMKFGGDAGERDGPTSGTLGEGG